MITSLRYIVMKRILLSMLGAIAVIASVSVRADNQVVMTVGDTPVTLSEFQYFYHKNQSQEDTASTIDRYALLFADFKRKVLEAKACGLDTISSYLADMQRYGRELAQPYVWDNELADSLMRVAYSHFAENVEVSHILISVNPSSGPARAVALADSLYHLAMAGSDFSELARKYSAQHDDGYLGFVSGGTVPYSLEQAIFDTPVGECAVAASAYGYHLIKVLSRRPDKGRVKVRHLLLLTPKDDDARREEVAARADSLYRVAIASPDDFETLAGQYTEDPSGKNTGGNLDWFGAGRMVYEFEKAAFELADGEISRPVLTPYGYHIIKREAWLPTPDFEEIQPEIKNMIMADERQSMIRRRAIERMWEPAGVEVVEDVYGHVKQLITAAGGFTADVQEELLADTSVVARISSQKVVVNEVVRMLGNASPDNADAACGAFTDMMQQFINLSVADWMVATLPEREPDYANLYNEYSDGMLLYEICQREIWGKPQSDPAGLEAYFQANRDRYTWDTEHYRGMVVMAVNDSIADAALAYLSTLPDTVSSYRTELRKRFLTNANVEHVVAAKADNQVVDYIAFNGPVPTKVSNRWVAFRPFRGEVVSAPTCATDVRGRVSVDYQEYLEERFMEYLRKKYPACINYELLHTL